MISDGEAAKYPFLKEAVKLVETLSLKVDDLIDPSFEAILDRGEERVSEAIVKGIVSPGVDDALSEVLSFPIAIMLVTYVDDNFLSRRYTLAEAARTFRHLKGEKESRILQIARDEFKWNLRKVRFELDGQFYGFELYFSDYLRNAAYFHEDKWKLVNRFLSEGYVLLTMTEAARLIQVEVEELISRNISKTSIKTLPEAIQFRADRIKILSEQKREKIRGEELPSEVVSDAFPPCMRYAFEAMMSGKRASHMERFALTSFLINAGMKLERIIQLFVSVTDFDEHLTRYQIEHIAGLRGSRIQYSPPTCTTLRTHGICIHPDSSCRKIRHPLSYYRNKIRQFKQKNPNES